MKIPDVILGAYLITIFFVDTHLLQRKQHKTKCISK